MANDAREGRPAQERPPVKNEVANALIDMMERGVAPWQRPWDLEANSPVSLATGRPYRGVNLWLLAGSGHSGGFATFRQAAERGWNVRKGEKGTMIVKVVELAPEQAAEGGSGSAARADAKQGKAKSVLMRYYVFGRDQLENPPPALAAAPRDFEPIERAQAVLDALVERTRMTVAHGGNHAYYDGKRHHIQLPPIGAHHSLYDAHAGAMHEASHAAMSETCGGLSKSLYEKWEAREAYALEELRAEMSSAILAAKTGVAPDPNSAQWRSHMENHAAYLSSWIKAVRSDPLAIFSAARDAEKVSEYLLTLALEREQMSHHREWVDEYESAPLARQASRELAMERGG